MTRTPRASARPPLPAPCAQWLAGDTTAPRPALDWHAGFKLISWNLLHRDGAKLPDLARLIERHQPDLLMLQEATEAIEGLAKLVGGAVSRTPLPGRVHGLAVWTPHEMAHAPAIVPLPSGAIVHRVAQLIDTGACTIANVHLSQGQLLNRRQLRHVAKSLPYEAAIIGDFNLVGPTLVPGFHDAGPRRYTHRMSDLVPLRLDRCLIRGLVATQTEVASRGASDHCPIILRLSLPSEIGKQQPHSRVA